MGHFQPPYRSAVNMMYPTRVLPAHSAPQYSIVPQQYYSSQDSVFKRRGGVPQPLNYKLVPIGEDLQPPPPLYFTEAPP